MRRGGKGRPIAHIVEHVMVFLLLFSGTPPAAFQDPALTDFISVDAGTYTAVEAPTFIELSADHFDIVER